MNIFPRQLFRLGVLFFFTPAAAFAQCPAPANLTILSSSSISASFSWSGSPASTLYQWEIGLPGFNPGNNEFLLRDSTTDTTDLAFGLVSATVLELYVRAICNNDASAWSAPLQFVTDPGCNDEFTDPGGPLGNYPNSAMDTALICPLSDTEVVKLTLLTFATEENGDFLKIYDGTDASAPQIANISGVYLPPLDTLPGPFVATNASGCLYTLFFSNSINNDEGWLAFVECVPPDSCLGLANLNVDTFSGNFAQISWTPLFGAGLFEWELGVAPFDTSGIPILSDTTTADSLLLTNLSSQTEYVLLIRARCDSTSYSDWFSITFSTPIACGDTLYDSGGPDSTYMPNENYTTTICPDSVQHTVTLTFSDFQIQNNNDYLIIYNGTGTTAPAMDTLTGNPTPPIALTATNATGCLTIQFISDANGQQQGWVAPITCDTATDCYDPIDLNLDFVNSDSAAVSWTGIFGAAGYLWALDTAATFVPGTGMALRSDTATINALALDSLESGTTYYLFIKTLCASDTSAWFGPLAFTTPPGCGDVFYDSGGANADYFENETITTVICPDTAGQVVTLTFTAFDLGNGDTLRLYNGDSINPLLVLDTLTSGPGTPGPYTATVASGCITAYFTSDDNNQKPGWAANVTCAAPTGCNSVLLLKIDSLGGSSVQASWVAMAGALQYEWKIGLSPYSPSGGTALDSGLVSGNTVFIDSLGQLKTYDLWVRTICASDSSDWESIQFTTKVNCFSNTNILACNSPASAFSTGGGDWIFNCSTDSTDLTLGQETVFQFTAPVSKTFSIDLEQVTGGNYANFLYKEASDGCNDSGWECIGGGNGNDILPFLGPLTAGVNYLILVDPDKTDTTTINFRIFDCAPLNENADSAITLIVNNPCTGNVHANGTADYTDGEPDPDRETNATDSLAGRWLTGANQTVWFKFEAPVSGTVTISTDELPIGSNFDSQVALYSVSDPSDYSTFTYIESDEDNGVTANGLNAVLYYTGLNPGETYYIQVDGYGTSSGTFCIEVLDGIYRFSNDVCTETYSVTGVDGTVSGGDRWYGIYGGQDSLDLGLLIAAIKPGPQKLDTVSCQFTVYTDSIPVASNGVPYMPAYFNFSSSTPPTDSVSLRLFFYNYELDALKLYTQLFNNTADNLVVSHYTGPDPDCSPLQHSITDVTLLDTALTSAVNTSGTASFYLEFTTTKAQLGEFGAHFGLIALPIELKSFTGTVLPRSNRLQWITMLEKNVQWHIIERSADGITWTETGRQSGLPHSVTEREYQMEDTKPLPQAYYRLRTADLDGKQQVANAIFLVRDEAQLRIANAFPSPTLGELTVQFVSPEETALSLRLFDLNGRLVLEQKPQALKGLNTSTLDISHLQSGIYSLVIAGANAVTSPVRIVKN